MVTGLGLCLALNSGAQTLLDTPEFGELNNLSIQAVGSLVYNSTQGNLFSGGVNPPAALDDGFFVPGTGPTLVNGVNFGYRTVNTDTNPITAIVSFFNTLTGNSSPVNTGLLGGFAINLGRPANGLYQSGMIDLSALPGGGIVFPDDNWAVSIVFIRTGTNILSTNATPLFAGGPPALGANVDVYWRDANNNGMFDDPGDARFFGGPPNLSQFYLQLAAVPEPGSVAMLVGFLTAGAGALIRRRRK
jgi:hypothetical protein